MFNKRVLLAALLVFLAGVTDAGQSPRGGYDIIIRNGAFYDGTDGAPRRSEFIIHIALK